MELFKNNIERIVFILSLIKIIGSLGSISYLKEYLPWAREHLVFPKATYRNAFYTALSITVILWAVNIVFRVLSKRYQLGFSERRVEQTRNDYLRCLKKFVNLRLKASLTHQFFIELGIEQSDKHVGDLNLITKDR